MISGTDLINFITTTTWQRAVPSPHTTAFVVTFEKVNYTAIHGCTGWMLDYFLKRRMKNRQASHVAENWLYLLQMVINERKEDYDK